MNYKIKSIISDVVIGTQTFTSTAIDLVDIKCLSNEYFSTLYEKVKGGHLSILLKNAVISDPLHVVSKLITIKESGLPSKDHLLNDDWEDKLKNQEANFVNENLYLIDKEYNQRVKNGNTFYRKKRAEMVEKILSETITSDDAFHIDNILEKVQFKLITGDWKSAKKYLELTTTDALYTQAIKDEYMSEITTYITNNY